MARTVVIVEAKRTPIGAFNGQFKNLSATTLGGNVLKNIIKNISFSIDEVIMGCVVQAGLGQNPARQAALSSGMEWNIPCSTINKVCGSGMKSVMLGVDSILSGRNHTVLAGGMESMTNAPYLLDKARFGYKAGHYNVIDALYNDGLEDAYTPPPSKNGKTLMGQFADATAKKYGFSRQDQEQFAKETFQNYKQSQTFIKNEIVPISLTPDDPNPIITDEPPLKVDPLKFQKLRPAFDKDGTVTAATSSSLADGAAALLLMDEEEALKRNLKPLARIVAQAEHSQEAQWFTTAPVGAIQKVIQNANWSLKDVDLFEINEAFAVVPMAAMADLGIDRSKINVFGGACTLGHPIGMSGTRIIVTLLNALKTKGLKRGIASTCIGGGEATSIALEVY
ncbi:MAG: thiolase family protein [Proteobacteria bacterium]|nr:thiolase family protein [Pseudomonadota bacterium]